MNISKLFLLFLFLPFWVLANNQDSLTVFKELNLSQQHTYLKEQLNSIKNAEVYIAAFLDEATKKKDTHYIATSYYFKNRIYRKSKAYAKAHSAINTAILLATKSKNDSLLGSFYHAKGATFYFQSKYPETLDFYLKADEIMKKKGSMENRLTLQFDIATYKLKITKEKEALVEFNKILYSFDSLLTTKPYSRFLQRRFIKMLNSTALRYTEKGLYDKAIELYSKSLSLCETPDFITEKCTAIGGKGNVYTTQKEYNKAILQLDEALEISTKNPDLYLITPYLLLDKGKCLFGLEKYDKALEILQEAYTIITAKQVNFIKLDKVYPLLAKTHVKLGNHEKATTIYSEYIKRNDLNKDMRFALHQTIFGYDLKNEKERADKAEETSSLFKKYFVQTIVLAVLSLLSVIIFFVYYRNVQKQKLRKFHQLIEDLKTKEVKIQKTSSSGYVLSDEKTAKILDDLEALEAKLFFLDKKYNLTTLAKKCNTNSSYLSKVINSHKGKTFSEYMTDMRITYVLNALKNDKKLRSYTIQSIAEEIGFKKSESFAKAFKKQTGLNPSFYIKNLEDL